MTRGRPRGSFEFWAFRWGLFRGHTCQDSAGAECGLAASTSLDSKTRGNLVILILVLRWAKTRRRHPNRTRRSEWKRQTVGRPYVAQNSALLTRLQLLITSDRPYAWGTVGTSYGTRTSGCLSVRNGMIRLCA